MISTCAIQAQLAPSGWAKTRGNLHNTGLGIGAYATPTLAWYAKGLLPSFNTAVNTTVIGPDGTLYITNGLSGWQDSFIEAVDGRTGILKWGHFHMGGYIYTPAVGANNMVYTVDGNYIYCFAADSGAFQWLNSAAGATFVTIGNDGTVFAGKYAFDGDTGAVKWTFNQAGSGPIACVAIDKNGILYAGDQQADAFAIDAKTGSLLWFFKTNGSNSVAPVIGPDGTIYFGSQDHLLYASDPTGKVKWTFDTGYLFTSSPAIGPDGTIYLHGNFGNDICCYAIDRLTGLLKWKYVLVPGVSQQYGTDSISVGADGTVYCSGQYTTTSLYALDGQTGNVKWTYNSKNNSSSEPVIGPDGTLYMCDISDYYALKSIHVLSVTVSPISVLGGNPTTGTVTLTDPAPDGGITVQLASGSPNATLTNTLIIPAGQKTATFTINTVAVSTVTKAIISATPGLNVNTTLTIVPAAAASLSLNPANVSAGGTSTGTVTLNGPAGLGGLSVTLSSDKSSAIVPATVSVPFGQTAATFTVTTLGVDASTTANITASLNGGTPSAGLTITPSTLTGLSLSPTSVISGSPSTGTVTLSGPSGPSGTVVSLASDSSFAVVPPSITVAAGKMTGTFTVGTNGVNSASAAKISATLGSATQSATLKVNPGALIGLVLVPTSVVGGNNSTGTITLSGAAGPGGLVVSLTSSNPAATVPGTVSVAAGATSATFSISTIGVSSLSTSKISATANGQSMNATLTMTVASLVSVTLNPSSVVGGTPSTGTVSLNGQAGALGLTVGLTSSNLIATVPSLVAFQPGQSSATFTVSTSGVIILTTSTISASLNSVTQKVVLTMTPTKLVSLTVNPTSVAAGNSSSGTVTLDGPAGANGLTVFLSSNNSAAIVPATILVPFGQTSVSFVVNTNGVNASTITTITGSLNGNTATATLTVTPAIVANISFNPGAVIGGNPSQGTVTLSGPSGSSGTVVLLSSSSAFVTAPTSVTIPSGQKSATFPVSTKSVDSQISAGVTGTLSGAGTTGFLTVNLPTLSSVGVNPNSVLGGASTTGSVTLTGPAGPSGVVVSLSSSSGVVSVPSTVTIPSGSNSVNFTVTTAGVGSQTTATISASWSGITQTATVTVSPATIASFTINPTTVVGGNSVTGTVTLSGSAGAGGVSIALASSSINATVPSTVTVAQGQSSVDFQVATLGVTSATSTTLTATLGSSSQTATLSITASTLASVSFNPASVPGGTNSTGTVSLTGAAGPGGFVVSLASKSPTVVVPSTVTIPAGQSSASFTVKTLAVSVLTNVPISAKLGNAVQSGILTVTPATLQSLTLNPSTVTGLTSSVGTVTLTGLAASSGMVVKLSSNNPAAIVPASVTILGGKSSATFTVKTLSVKVQTPATISGSLNGNTASAVLVINAPSILSLSLNPTTLKGGKTSTGTVTLSGPAPTGGLVVSIASTKSAATVPSSVTILAGKTSATFIVKTTTVTAVTSASIVVSAGSSSKTASLTIQ